MTGPKLWALVVLLHISSANLYCDNILRVSTELDDLKKDVKTLMAERNELKNKVERLNANRSAAAFTVRFSTDNAYVGLPLRSGQILQFDDVVTNTGNAYDRGTGIFTAPKSGDYAFFLNVMGIGAHGHLAIKKNDQTLTLVYSKASIDPSDQGTTMVTSYLTAGDKVWVSHLDLNAIRGGWYTIFTGFLTLSH